MSSRKNGAGAVSVTGDGPRIYTEKSVENDWHSSSTAVHSNSLYESDAVTGEIYDTASSSSVVTQRRAARDEQSPPTGVLKANTARGSPSHSSSAAAGAAGRKAKKTDRESPQRATAHSSQTRHGGPARAVGAASDSFSASNNALTIVLDQADGQRSSSSHTHTTDDSNSHNGGDDSDFDSVQMAIPTPTATAERTTFIQQRRAEAEDDNQSVRAEAESSRRSAFAAQRAIPSPMYATETPAATNKSQSYARSPFEESGVIWTEVSEPAAFPPTSILPNAATQPTLASPSAIPRSQLPKTEAIPSVLGKLNLTTAPEPSSSAASHSSRSNAANVVSTSGESFHLPWWQYALRKKRSFTRSEHEDFIRRYQCVLLQLSLFHSTLLETHEAKRRAVLKQFYREFRSCAVLLSDLLSKSQQIHRKRQKWKISAALAEATPLADSLLPLVTTALSHHNQLTNAVHAKLRALVMTESSQLNAIDSTALLAELRQSDKIITRIARRISASDDFKALPSLSSLLSDLRSQTSLEIDSLSDLYSLLFVLRSAESSHRTAVLSEIERTRNANESEKRMFEKLFAVHDSRRLYDKYKAHLEAVKQKYAAQSEATSEDAT